MAQSNGETIKFIRESLAYSQAYVAEGVMTQSSYSKAERGDIELTFSKMRQILQKFGMTMDEYLYIKNGYSHGDDSGLQELRRMDFSDEKSLRTLKSKLEQRPNPSQRSQEYISICEAMLRIATENDYDAAKEKVAKIWRRLEKHDTWFLADIFLLNNILFVFPIDTAILITEKVLEQLHLYKGLRELDGFAANFTTNLIVLLLRNERYEECQVKLTEHIADCKQNRLYLHLALAYARQGILLNKRGETGEAVYYEKCFAILGFVDYQQLEEDVKKEISHYTGVSV